jgi:hypothetical protein
MQFCDTKCIIDIVIDFYVTQNDIEEWLCKKYAVNRHDSKEDYVIMLTFRIIYRPFFRAKHYQKIWIVGKTMLSLV